VVDSLSRKVLKMMFCLSVVEISSGCHFAKKGVKDVVQTVSCGSQPWLSVCQERC
jgi:hypothetical protein